MKRVHWFDTKTNREVITETTDVITFYLDAAHFFDLEDNMIEIPLESLMDID